MGLLDSLTSEQGLLGLSLLAAAAPKERRTSLGEGLLMASQNVMQQRNAQEERAARMRMQQMQEQQLQMQLADRQRQQQQMEERSRYLSRLDPNQGPPMEATPAGAMAAGLSPQEFSMVAPQKTDPMSGFDKLSPKDYTPESLQQFMQTRNPAVLRAAPKDDKPPADWQLYQLSGAAQRGMSFDAWDQARRRAGATNVSMGYGSPIAGIGPDGQPAFIMPPKDPTKAGPMILPGVKPPASAGDKLTEDQGKATAWLAQAENAYKNMLEAGFTKDGKPKSAAYPGPADALEKAPVVGAAANVFRSADRQKFIQASSSLSEALLRAATGAGVNIDEAKQKIAELTPQFGERAETTEQKMRAIPVYIQTLKVRAGPGAAKLPASGPKPAADNDPLGLRN